MYGKIKDEARAEPTLFDVQRPLTSSNLNYQYTDFAIFDPITKKVIPNNGTMDFSLKPREPQSIIFAPGEALSKYDFMAKAWFKESDRRADFAARWEAIQDSIALSPQLNSVNEKVLEQIAPSNPNPIPDSGSSKGKETVIESPTSFKSPIQSPTSPQTPQKYYPTPEPEGFSQDQGTSRQPNSPSGSSNLNPYKKEAFETLRKRHNYTGSPNSDGKILNPKTNRLAKPSTVLKAMKQK